MDKNVQKQLLEIVKRNYEEIADDFSETRRKLLWPELTRLAGMAKDGDSVLDAGCGNGRLLEIFKNKKIKYLGLDQSTGLIKAAKENFPALADNFMVGDILSIEMAVAEKFDYIFFIAVLPHLPGEDLRLVALGEMKKRLRSGGKMIITAWKMWPQGKYLKMILKHALLKIIGLNKMDFGDIVFFWKNKEGASVSQRYYHAFRKKELIALVAKADLRIDDFRQDKYNYYLILS